MRLVLAALLSALFAFPAFAVEMMNVKAANEASKAGEIVLIDIRTPQEWADTGTAPQAKPIDMTSAAFMDELGGVIAANPGKKLAFICRSGNRSGMLTSQLESAGLTNIIDVEGGMNQWMSQGLPVKK
jgi:rhodanese-related sulfurtransferase